MKRRWRTPSAKPGQLLASFGRVDGDLDIAYSWGGGGASSPDGRVLACALEEAVVFDGKPLRQVLADRGYDLTTLRFSVMQRPRRLPMPVTDGE